MLHLLAGFSRTGEVESSSRPIRVFLPSAFAGNGDISHQLAIRKSSGKPS
jgi:hypothetical protein